MTKFIKFLFIFILTLPIVSCSSDKDDDSSDSIVGVWRKDFSRGYKTITYNNNGTFTEVEIDYSGGNWSDVGTYTVKGNILTRNYDDETEVFTILSLTQSKLITRYEGEYVGQHQDYYPDDISEYYRVK